jgi:hypothetical protein
MGLQAASVTCPSVDPMYPTGCPAGFTAQQIFYVPNSEQPLTYGTPGPGAVPMPNPSIQNCNQSFSCVNAQGQSPIAATQGTCPTLTPAAGWALGATALAVFLLPGVFKLLALPVGFFAFIFSGQQWQAQPQPDGSIKCVVTGASGM